MAQVEPPTKITEPIPRIVRPGRPARTETSRQGPAVSNGHKNTGGQHVVVPPLPEGLSKGQWSEQAVKVLKERYLLKNDNGEVIETPDQMCWRVAWDIACAEANFGRSYDEVVDFAKEYYKLLVIHLFLPNSPTLANAGKNNGLQYAACYVIPVEDSIEGIFDGVKWQAMIHHSGGGTGFSFSRLRPNGSIVGSTKGISSGPVAFMKVYDAATQQIKQGGMRRGANMGILRVDHPDILEFIHCKDDGESVQNFNISVAATDVFMKAYFEGTKYDLVDPHTKRIIGQLDARTVIDEIARGAWKTGDPGMIFVDRVNAGTCNPVPSLGPVEATNPCGEQPLYPFDACNLGSIFLTYFVKEENGKKEVDWQELERVTKLAVRFLDSVIERNPFTLPQIGDMVTSIRRIGLGVGGWADMLVELGIPYDSEEALELGERVMRFINEKAHEASEELALERGAFPMWSESIYKDGKPIRNSTVTTIAPTGSIGIIADSSTGIEPKFAIAFKHYVKTNAIERSLYYFDKLFEEYAKGKEWYTEEVKEKIALEGTIAHIAEIPEEVRKLFVTAHEINPEWHVKMQAAFQKYTDNAVSKTINLPNSAAVEDIKRAYVQAYELGCNGITVYRDGSKSIQVLNLGTKEKEEVSKELVGATNGYANGHGGIVGVAEGQFAALRPRPMAKLAGVTYRTETPLGHAFITINSTPDGEPFEVFIAVGHGGSDVAADAEAIGRLISMSLRIADGISPRQVAWRIVDQLRGIGGPAAVGFGSNKVKSLADAVAKVLTDYLQEMEPQQLAIDPELVKSAATAEVEAKKDQAYGGETSEEVRRDLCPSCGAGAFVFEEGCAKCYTCGYSKC